MSNTINKYIQQVSDATGTSYEKCKTAMKKVKSQYGISFKYYNKYRLYDVHPSNYEIYKNRIALKEMLTEQRFEFLEKETGLTKDEILDEIKEINQYSPIKVTSITYKRYALYGKSKDEVMEILQYVQAKRAKAAAIKEQLALVDTGSIEIKSVVPSLKELGLFIEKNILPVEIQTAMDIFSKYDETILNDEGKQREIAADMETCRLTIGASNNEYTFFHLKDKNWPTRYSFIYHDECQRNLNELNSHKYEIFTRNKYKCYQLLKQYYHRDATLVESIDDLAALKEFCKGKKYFVVKPTSAAFGKGIRKVEVPFFKGKLKELAQEILEESGPFIAEELLIAHDTIKALNPDSVNTVRLVTCYNGKDVKFQKALMKVGQKGSFVDNGGSGGIFVSVDPQTGIFNSPGCDEHGIVYHSHPYTEVQFVGYQLPDWQAALELGKEIAPLLPHCKYTGWDLTYTSDNRWVVVEGNDRTQFIGQQCTIDIGMRQEFLDMVKWLKEEE